MLNLFWFCRWCCLSLGQWHLWNQNKLDIGKIKLVLIVLLKKENWSRFYWLPLIALNWEEYKSRQSCSRNWYTYCLSTWFLPKYHCIVAIHSIYSYSLFKSFSVNILHTIQVSFSVLKELYSYTEMAV